MAISQYILTPEEEQRLQRRSRGLALVRIRYFYVGLLGSVAVITGILANLPTKQIITYGAIAVVGLISNTIIAIILGSAHRKPIAYTIGTYAAIILDISLATGAVFTQGGYSSRATVLYAVPILSSGVLLLRPSAYVIAALSGVSYAGVLIYQYLTDHVPATTLELMTPIIFYPVAFQILASIISRFSAANAINQNQVAYSQFLGIVRQQLKQSPATIAAALQAIEDDSAYSNLTSKQQDLLNKIKEENYQSTMTISNLLDNAQHRTTDTEDTKESLDLSELVRNTALNCATGAARIPDLDLSVQDNIEVLADGAQLRTAIYNVLDNAFRYSVGGTPVQVELVGAHKLAALVITDQGRGMTSDQQKAVMRQSEQFENNRTTKNPTNTYSTGLGLHVSKLTIERFGGTLDIFSQPKVGTKVTIHLPKK